MAIFLSDLAQHMLKSVVLENRSDEEYGIMLDHSLVQELMNLVLPSEGEWLTMETNLSPLYLAPDILQGSISFREFLLPYDMEKTPPWNNEYARVCMFITNILVNLSSNSSNAKALKKVDETELVSLGLYTHVAVHALHAACIATYLLEMNDSLNDDKVPSDTRVGTNHLKDDMESLLKKLNPGNKKLIVKQIKDR